MNWLRKESGLFLKRDDFNISVKRATVDIQGITFKGRDRAAPLDAPLKIKKES